MRIVSWNMRKKKGNWNYLTQSLDPDFALLQESSPIEDFIPSKFITEVTVKKNLRNSIFVKHGIFASLDMPDDEGMGLNVIKADAPSYGAIYFISIYGNLMFSPFLHTKLEEFISLYVCELRKIHNAKHILIAGDFNMDRMMDENPTGSRFVKKGERTHNLFFDSIVDLGFSDCLRKFHPNYLQTYRHNRGNYPWELDHMFATNDLYHNLQSIEVLSSEQINTLSDHNPIVADFK
jgi:endonuclease/exonuclease/phosphatase family metal-dependent hydrolase